MIRHDIGYRKRDKDIQAEPIEEPEKSSMEGSMDELSVHDTRKTAPNAIWRSPEEEKEAISAWNSEY